MTDKNYNYLVELRNKCYRDRRDRETEINYFTGFNDGYEKGRESLEKENANLRVSIESTRCAGIELLSDKRKQLTKAKDLFLRFIELKNKPCASGHSINMLLYENICAEAEQFLNEVEK